MKLKPEQQVRFIDDFCKSIHRCFRLVLVSAPYVLQEKKAQSRVIRQNLSEINADISGEYLSLCCSPFFRACSIEWLSLLRNVGK